MSRFLHHCLATLQLTPKNDLKALHCAVEQAQSAYDKAQSNLHKTYTSHITSLAQSFVSTANTLQYSVLVVQAAKFNIVESAFMGIEVAMNKTTAAHDVVNSTYLLDVLPSFVGCDSDRGDGCCIGAYCNHAAEGGCLEGGNGAHHSYSGFVR